MKRCGFVIRVSTDVQARNPEGSLKNQLQRLNDHIEYKDKACGENWIECGRYVLKGVSGKDAFRSPEFAQLFEDIKSGKVNTVVCTALDRVSRSVKDFLNFFEILAKHNVEFVCLKQNYDTTSPQGKLFITIMMALAEFEREQTSERNKDATLARAERGLWNGGQLLGYDIIPGKKGYVVPNEKEKSIVQFAFKRYLECGSLIQTTREMNERGYRTKAYTSRRHKVNPARTFGRTTINQFLMNCAYIGLKEINKKNKPLDQSKLPENQKYKTVKSVWEPLVDEATFYKVQDLLKKNARSKHNETALIKHVYLLNGGLVWCEKCGNQMEGICGTGRLGQKYFYYVCKNKECRFKVPADELERIVIERIRQLSNEKDAIDKSIENANAYLQSELPRLKTEREMLDKELTEVKDTASGIIDKLAPMANGDNGLFLKEKLDDLGKRRKQIEHGIEMVQLTIDQIEREAVDKEIVLEALKKFGEVFDNIEPYQQKELMKLVLAKAIIGPDHLKVALYGRPGNLENTLNPETEEARCGMPNWLPETDRIRTFLSCLS